MTGGVEVGILHIGYRGMETDASECLNFVDRLASYFYSIYSKPR